MPHPASGISLFQSVQSLHISADLRDEGVAAGGDDSPHRVLILIQHSSLRSGQDQSKMPVITICVYINLALLLLVQGLFKYTICNVYCIHNINI